MRVKYACAAGLLVIASLANCASRQAARVQDANTASRPGEPVTAEDVIREHDLERLWSLEEYADEQHDLDAEIALLDGERAGDADYPPEEQEHKLESFGRATWSVFVVAFTLGMAALPFLV